MAASVLAIALNACAGEDDGSIPGGEQGVRPPAAGPENPGDGAGVVLAVSELYLGDVDRDGHEDPEAWRQYGFDIDGLISADGTGACQPVAGAPDDVHVDGDGGRDNAFGKSILELVEVIAPEPSSTVNAAIAEGTFSILLDVEGLGAGADYNPLVTRLYGGDDLGGPPKFDGTDVWPVMPELLEGGSIDTPKVVFSDSYVVDDTWVSGSPTTVDLVVNIAGYTITLKIDEAVLAVELDPSHTSGGRGTLSGVIATEEIVQQIRLLMTGLSDSFCDVSSLDPILEEIRQASDIMKDGTQDPSATCDGISIGIGFDVEAVNLGEVGEPAQLIPSKCAG